jgi:uncharacterized DUF497 family protein
MVVRLEFDWDPAKAASNRVKHGVSFDEAMTVFADPLALSRLDVESAVEERWVTLGMSGPSRSLVVVHTHIERTDDRITIRIISARRASRKEARQYEEG